MNPSRYNVVATGPDDETLLYNTANGSFAALSPEAAAACQRGTCPDEKLEQAGFFTELSPEEELEQVKKQHRVQRTSADELALTIAPTYACNFKCPYCYEAHHATSKGIMSREVLDAIYAFVEQRYAQAPFGRLFVEWYGGDPSLCLDIVRDFSRRLVAFAEEHGVFYDAMMLTNCNLIDAAAVELLADARVSEVFVTIDGLEDEHNKRVSATGSNSYANNIEAIRLLTARGIRVTANMNVDKVNIKQLPAVRKMLREQFGIEMVTEQLNDYRHFFGQGAFCAPDFELFTHDEYAQAIHDEQKESGVLTPEALRTMLQPVPNFCRGQMENYFVIDAFGDVYACDGWMGDKRHRVCNILDASSGIGEHLHEVVALDATLDEKVQRLRALARVPGELFLGAQLQRRLPVPSAQAHHRGIPARLARYVSGSSKVRFRFSPSTRVRCAGICGSATHLAFTARDMWQCHASRVYRTGYVAVPLISRLPHGICGSATLFVQGGFGDALTGRRRGRAYWPFSCPQSTTPRA